MPIPLITNEQYEELKRNKPVPIVVNSFDELPKTAADKQTALVICGEEVIELIYHDGWMDKNY